MCLDSKVDDLKLLSCNLFHSSCTGASDPKMISGILGNFGAPLDYPCLGLLSMVANSLTKCWVPSSSLWISCTGGLILVYGDGLLDRPVLVDQSTHVHCIRNWVSSTGLAIPFLFRHEPLFVT